MGYGAKAAQENPWAHLPKSVYIRVNPWFLLRIGVHWWFSSSYHGHEASDCIARKPLLW